MNIRLRAIEPEDLDLLYSIENDTRLWDVGTTNVPYSRYTLHDYIATSSDDVYADRQVRLIVENAQGQAVGIADLVNFDPRHLRAEVGLVIMSDYRRQGYASAALNALVRYATAVLHLHQLYAVIAQSNVAAMALFAKSEFFQGAQLKDWLYVGSRYEDALVMQRVLL